MSIVVVKQQFAALVLSYLSTLHHLSRRLPTPVLCGVLYQLIMSFVYDYLSELAARDGSTVSELRRSMRPAVITDESAQARGYATASEYEEALHEFLNSQ